MNELISKIRVIELLIQEAEAAGCSDVLHTLKDIIQCLQSEDTSKACSELKRHIDEEWSRPVHENGVEGIPYRIMIYQSVRRMILTPPL